MDLLWIILGFFIFCMFVFFAFVIFLPEWVGITGKEAHKNLASHSSNQVEEGAEIENFIEGKSGKDH
jgi:hypothetical protein